MTLDLIINTVARELGLPKNLVDKAYRAYWKAVREHIVELPLKEDLSDEDFKSLQPNINIPSIGKLYVTLERYRKMKSFNKVFEEKNQLKQKGNATYKEN